MPDDLLHAVRVAARSDALLAPLAPTITRKLINRYVSQPSPARPASDSQN